MKFLKGLSYFFAAYYLVIGMLMAFKVIEVDYLLIGVMALLSSMRLFEDGKNVEKWFK